MFIKKIFFLCIIMYGTMYAEKKGKHDSVEQLKIGNFTLSSSQQPSSLWGIGQNIVDKHDLQVFLFSDVTLHQNKNSIEVGPSILYGIRDNLSLFMQWPASNRFGFKRRDSSPQNTMITQLEYAFYTNETTTTSDQITLITSLLFPFGKESKDDFKSNTKSFLLGLTAGHWSTTWYYYGASAIEITMQHKQSKQGNEFLYQGGFGRNIAYSAEKWILTLMLEFNGTYTQKRVYQGVTIVQSESNILVCGPSVWFSTKKLTAQGGIAFPLFQNFNNSMAKKPFLLSIYCGYKLT